MRNAPSISSVIGMSVGMGFEWFLFSSSYRRAVSRHRVGCDIRTVPYISDLFRAFLTLLFR